eukprot:gene24624-30992_t
MGTMSNILASGAPRKAGESGDPSEFHFPGKRPMSNAHMNFNGLIGGQAPEGDPYKSTAQSSFEGSSAALDNKPANCKKMLSEVDPQQMISPITGELIANYGTWAEDLIAKRNNQHVEEEEAVEEDPIMAKLKSQLAGRGAKGVVGLGRLFKIMDDDGSNSLNFPEFKKAMRECGMTLSDTEIVMLFKRFDRSGTGYVQYNDFLNTITGSLNPKRRKLVNMAFDVLDRDGSGLIDLADIALAYDVSQHPDFKAGKKTKDQVLLEFLAGFDVGGVSDGQVTREEFANYYTQISSSIERDDYFELMIRNAWHISGGEGQAANSSNTRVLVTRADGSQYVEEIKNDLGLRQGDKEGMASRLKAQGVNAANISAFDGGDDNKQQLGSSSKVGGNMSKSNYTTKTGNNARGSPTKAKPGKYNQISYEKKETRSAEPSPGIKLIIAKIKAEMKSRGSGGFIGLQRRFKIMDDDGSKSLSLSEFKKALKEFKMDLSEVDLRQLFEYFDADSSGSIDFEEFIQGVRDPMTDRRLNLVKLAFNIIDVDGSGIVDGQEIASMYDPSKHPEVLSKRKTPAQVLREFLDTFDVGGVKDGMVTREEFINYYTNLSANIDNEDYFELMIRNAWHISGGEGQSANSSNMRVLVTDFTGKETTVTLNSDLGLKGPDDINGIYSRLAKQGVKDVMAINGKMLKKVNVNGVEVVTVQGAVSSIEKDDREAKNRPNVGKAPVFSRTAVPSAPGAISQPLMMTGSGARPGSSSRGNMAPPSNPNLNIRNSLTHTFQAQGSKGQLAGQMLNSMQQQTIRQNKETEKDIVGNTLLDVVRVQLLARGPAGIIDLQRKFIEMDTDNSKALDKNEFRAAMQANQVTFSDKQLDTLFAHFDADRSGTIDYVELLNGLRGQLSPKLLVLVHRAFDLMDHSSTGLIDPQLLLTHYDATRHPDVLTGTRRSEDVLKEFLDTFDVGGEVPGQITRGEFVNYYSNIAAAVNDDQYLEIILQKVWHLNENYEANMEKLTLKQNTAARAESTLAARLKQAQSFAEQTSTGPETTLNNNWSGNDVFNAPSRGDEGSAPYLPQQQQQRVNNNNTGGGRTLMAQQPPSQRRPSSASAVRRPSNTYSYNQSSNNNPNNNFNNDSRVEYTGSNYNNNSSLQGQQQQYGNNNANNYINRPSSANSYGRSSANRGRADNNQYAQNNQKGMSEADIQSELKTLQTRSIALYNQGLFEPSLEVFTQVLAAVQLLYPPNHPEVIKAEKSVALVTRKCQAEQAKPTQHR